MYVSKHFFNGRQVWRENLPWNKNKTVIEIVCPQPAEFTVLCKNQPGGNGAKVTTKETKTKKTKKGGKRKKRVHHKAHGGVRQAETAAEVKEPMWLTKNSTQTLSSSSQDKFMDLSWTRNVMGGRGIQRGFSKSAEQHETTMMVMLMKTRGSVSPC